MLLLAASGLLGLTHAASFSINWASALGGSFAWLGGLLSVASLAGLFTLVLREKATAIRFTIVFCAVFYSAGLAWLYISMNRYGGMPSAMAAAR